MSDLPIKFGPSDVGTVFAASNHGGPTLPRVSLQLIFWGSFWRNPTSTPSADQVTTAALSIVGGPYLSGLLQYGVYLGTLRGTTFVDSNPPNPFGKNDWHGQIQDLIDNGTFPEPDEPGGLNLYMLIVPPGTRFTASDVGGEHGFIRNTLIDLDVAYGGWAGGDDLNNLTKNLSHEIVEACTDTEAQRNDAWTLDGRSHPNSEICDVCGNTETTVNGVSVKGYWSNFDKGCIVPTVFSLKRFMRMKGLDPSKGLGPVRPPVTSVRDFVRGG